MNKAERDAAVLEWWGKEKPGEIAARFGISAGLVYHIAKEHRAYSVPKPAHIRTVPLQKLQEQIIKPGIEKHLEPLLEFRGSLSLGRIHRNWNLLISMMEAECESLTDGVAHFAESQQFSHLCEPIITPERLSLMGFTSRIILSPQIKRLNPHVWDYAKLLNPGPFELTRVSRYTTRKDAAPWRVYEPKKKEHFLTARKTTVSAPMGSYASLIHEGNRPEHELMRLINNAVPRTIPPELRADICQDLAVGILCGDFDKDNLSLPVKEITKRVMKMFPTKYGDLSLDMPIDGTDGLTLMELISA